MHLPFLKDQDKDQNIDWQTVRHRFQEIWGYDDFRAPQGEIIQSLLTRQDALIVMPTGGGKSLCFQLPALLRQGLTLVVSPLVALMENQVQDLKRRRLPAALLHSELPSRDRKQVLWAIEHQKLRLLYLSPETLLSAPVWERLMRPEVQINGLILDEAHCLVQWGDTFRPAYRRLGTVRSALLQAKPHSPMAIAAFTATADPQAQQTIRQVLQLQEPQIFLQSPYRANLDLSVQIAWTPRDRRQKLLRFIQQGDRQAGLVYVRTRRDGEELATWLRQQGFQTAAYHAGLSPEERRQMEADWIAGSLQFVVCTSAFGMGIDKSNVRWVAHFHAPLLLSEYVQEVGRGGRDRKRSQALTLVSEPTGWLDSADQQRQQFFQNQMQKQQQIAQKLMRQLPDQGEISAVTRQFKEGAIALSLLHSTGQLEWRDPFHYQIDRAAKSQTACQTQAPQQMVKYLNSRTCRWGFLLDAFGFSSEAEALQVRGCQHCDRCRAN
ncbi:MAG TPA: RecQ family ATP-dependent DNA helicase [Coleofasciculaceae cyanobacterium]|jgi:ATP-dependent DNA helicase RecQ